MVIVIALFAVMTGLAISSAVQAYYLVNLHRSHAKLITAVKGSMDLSGVDLGKY